MPDQTTQTATPNPPAGEARPRAGLTKRDAKNPGLDWVTPSADVGLYAALPDAAADFHSGHGPTAAQVYDFLSQPAKSKKFRIVIHPDHSWHCDAPSLDKIARQMPGGRRSRSTVWRALKDLVETKAIQVRKVYYRNRDGGRIERSIYHGPKWADVLEARRRIPGVILSAQGHPIVYGRRRLPFTPENGGAKFEVNPAIAMPRRTVGTRPAGPPSVTDARVPKEAQLAEMPAPALDAEAVLARMLEYCPANLDDAQKLIMFARPDDGSASIPLDALLTEIDDIRARKLKFEKKGDPRPLNAKWFIDRISSHVGHWRERERKAKTGRDNAVREAREARIDSIAVAIGKLERDGREDGRTAPLDALEREHYQSAVDSATPDELAWAREVLAAMRQRSA